MHELTKIYRKGLKTPLTYEACLTVEEAIAWARDYGFRGRLEIHNILVNEDIEVVYAMYFINEENKIVGVVFPTMKS